MVAEASKIGPMIVFLKHAGEVAKSQKASLAFLGKLTTMGEAPVVIIASSTDCEEVDEAVSHQKVSFNWE